MGSCSSEPETQFFASDGAYSIPDLPMGVAKPLRLICVGAGASGINLIYQIRAHMKGINLAVYEKNEEVGGTWYENRYPGCACDIPAHNYQFTWAPNPSWKQFYASAGEIRQYLKKTAEDFGLESAIKFHHEVQSAVWDEDTGLWTIEILDKKSGKLFTDQCNFFMNGSGYLNHWKWPKISGLHSFHADVIHTANWKDNIDLNGKRVAVIGNGSSGMQALVAIYPGVKELISLSRSPTWVTPNFASDFASVDGGNFDYSEAQKKFYQEHPAEFLKYRKDLERAMTGSFSLSLTDSPLQKQAQEGLKEYMAKKLVRKDLTDALIPNFGVGCRRPTPGLGYLETLTKDNVRLVTTAIDSVLPQGIKLVTGEVLAVDVIICATGFDYSWIPRFPVTGRNKTCLSDLWKSRPAAYMGLAVQDMPNYFVFLGPQSPLSHGSAIPTIEQATKYMLRMIWKAQTECYKSFVPSTAAVDQFIYHNDVFHTRTIWGTKCRSWLKGGTEDGKVLTHCGSRIQNIHMMLNPRYEDFEWVPSSVNRFSFMGNGQTILEEEGRDATWYMNDGINGYEHIFY